VSILPKDARRWVVILFEQVVVGGGNPLVDLPLLGRAVPRESRPLGHLHRGVNDHVGDVVRRPSLPDQGRDDAAVRSIHPRAVGITELHDRQFDLDLHRPIPLGAFVRLFERQEQ
jgi:hypothetical protein